MSERLDMSPFLDALADELAPRVAAALNGHGSPRAEEPEPWRLLTLKEAAARLNRSARWVRQRKEQIGYVKLDGGGLGFEVDDLREFARSRRVGGR